ncbi:hypothetical protein NDU88_010797 [Pleurodeles waltl]|uniref:Uncharacterized protein n=1 Tax=Pleurodeles waltl TaxID=8319 RepID=A0AAV7PW98_PLEWA|nr:hypothetical protein NDU88_010797 [Pleurodeles waltl]
MCVESIGRLRRGTRGEAPSNPVEPLLTGFLELLPSSSHVGAPSLNNDPIQEGTGGKRLHLSSSTGPNADVFLHASPPPVIGPLRRPSVTSLGLQGLGPSSRWRGVGVESSTLPHPNYLVSLNPHPPPLNLLRALRCPLCHYTTVSASDTSTRPRPGSSLFVPVCTTGHSTAIAALGPSNRPRPGRLISFSVYTAAAGHHSLPVQPCRSDPVPILAGCRERPDLFHPAVG